MGQVWFGKNSEAELNTMNEPINEQNYRAASAAYKKTNIIQNVALHHTCDKESIDMLFARIAFASIGYGPWCNNLLH